jgi:hypothetical protein
MSRHQAARAYTDGATPAPSTEIRAPVVVAEDAGGCSGGAQPARTVPDCIAAASINFKKK